MEQLVLLVLTVIEEGSIDSENSMRKSVSRFAPRSVPQFTSVQVVHTKTLAADTVGGSAEMNPLKVSF